MVLNVEFRQVIISHLHLFLPSFPPPSVATQRKTNAKQTQNAMRMRTKDIVSFILFVIDKKLNYDLAVLEAGAG
jgi:hypothetical protein